MIIDWKKKNIKDVFVFPIAVISAIVSGLLAHFIASKLGYNVALWRAIGVVLGPVVVLTLLLLF